MKKTLIYSCYLLATYLLLSDCEHQTENDTSQLEFDETISEINFGKSFTLEMPNNHPDKIAIMTPDETWFYIQGNGTSKPHMPAEDFMKADTLTIMPDTLKGMHWVDGKEMISPVIIKQGIYSIYLSDNLETEIENSLTFIKKIELKD